jgi:hypothetical protein
MRKVVLLVMIVALGIMWTGGAAQGFFDGSVLGLGPHFGMDGKSLFGGEVKFDRPFVFYVGVSEDRSPSFGYGPGFPIHGLWLGLSKTVAVSDRTALIGSGWYLFGSNSETNWNGFDGWSAKMQWWFVDILGAYGSLNGFSLLAGFRYDYVTIRVQNPSDSGFFFSNIHGIADLQSKAYIPLIGMQLGCSGGSSSLSFRVVGFPYLFGNFSAVTSDNFLFGAAAPIPGVDNFRINGTLQGRYFIEFFTEYACRLANYADIGVFGRYSSTGGYARGSLDSAFGFVNNPTIVSRSGFPQSFQRNNWTLGGRISLSF